MFGSFYHIMGSIVIKEYADLWKKKENKFAFVILSIMVNDPLKKDENWSSFWLGNILIDACNCK